VGSRAFPSKKIDPRNQSLPLSLLINNVKINFFIDSKKENTLKKYERFFHPMDTMALIHFITDLPKK
jgi:hypothetical protein